MIPPIWLHNARLGAATNSSSTHSILILGEGAARPRDSGVRDQTYGWDHFTAASRNAKLAWLGQALASTVQQATQDEELAATAVSRMLAASGFPKVRIDPDGYVDHDSRFDLPAPRYGDGDLFKQALAFLANPRVVVLGGNDNDGVTHPLTSQGAVFSHWRLWEEGSKPARMRWDVRDSYWSAFQNASTYQNMQVTRFRWAVEPGAPIARAEVPELVDLSVGNRCTTGCRYCYRGSTPEQGYASAKDVLAAIHALRSLGTFEVALGGGEPLQHPEIEEIAKSLHENDVCVHVTTRELDWLTQPKRRRLFLDKFSHFGFSVDNVAAMKRASEMFEAEAIRDRINYQIVVGAMSQSALQDMLTYAKAKYLRVTLLGYKTSGFGANVKPRPIDPAALDLPYCVGIDSVLVQQWSAWLEKHAWSGSYTLGEGTFSCFVDAVTGKRHRNSFGNGPGFEARGPLWRGDKEVTFTQDTLKAAFAAMQVDAGIADATVTP